MGKRSRRKKRSEQPPRPNKRARRQARKIGEELAQRCLDMGLDPEIPPKQATEAILALFSGRPVPPEFAFVIANKTSPERAWEIAGAAIDLQPDDLASLTLAASVAEVTGDDRSAAEYYEAAAELTDDPEIRWRYAGALHDAGRNADSLEVLELLCEEDPRDWAVQELYADALTEANRRVRAVPPRDRCPCGSGKRFKKCCLLQEGFSLREFTARESFDRLRREVLEYSKRPEFERFHLAAMMRWFNNELEIEADEGEQRLFLEWAWRAIDTHDQEESDDCILGRFAMDPEVDEDLREQAEEWQVFGQWGLWMIQDPIPSPGTWLVDLLTSAKIYASFAPEQLEDLAPWTVILGELIPIDGVWRTGGAFMPMSPSLADAMVKEISRIAAFVVAEAARERWRRGVPRIPERFDGLPATAIADQVEPAPLQVCDFYSNVVRAALPDLLETLKEWSCALPKMSNTDGHPLLLVKAEVEIEIENSPDALKRLADDPDFDLRDLPEITWLGREMTPAEAETSWAQFKSFAAERGFDPGEPTESQRYTRGTIEVSGNILLVNVNSQERLETLIEILDGVGARPRIASRVTIDPEQDFARSENPPSAEPGAGMSKEALDTWQRHWADEHVPALRGMTPREAAKDEQGRILLEALLRDFEHRAATNLQRGLEDIDVTALRVELGLAS